LTRQKHLSINSLVEGKNNVRVAPFFLIGKCRLIVKSETTKLYLKVTEPELLGAMFDKALERYTTSDVDQFTKGQQ
jgi:hypothetical protein